LYNARPDAPDPIFAGKLQEVLGGQWGEISVMMGYLFQGWNCRGPAKYRDLLLDTATEEIAHVEILAVMIARLLEKSPVEAEEAANGGGDLGAIMGGKDGQEAVLEYAMNPQHVIVNGLGSGARDSAGNPWTAAYITASNNVMADFRFNVTAESQGRLQVSRLYELTDDAGVRDMLSFLIARDTMHQNQWLAAIEELEKDGLGGTPVPISFPQEREFSQVSYQLWNNSEGEESAQGRWANGPSKDGKGRFEYVADPRPLTDDTGELAAVDPRLHGTPRQPTPPAARWRDQRSPKQRNRSWREAPRSQRTARARGGCPRSSTSSCR
jgi:Mn-containing catalase